MDPPDEVTSAVNSSPMVAQTLLVAVKSPVFDDRLMNEISLPDVTLALLLPAVETRAAIRMARYFITPP